MINLENVSKPSPKKAGMPQNLDFRCFCLKNFKLGKVHLIWQVRGMKILREGGLQKFLDTREGASEKIVGLGGGHRKFVYFKTIRRWEGAPKKTELLARRGC